MSYLVDTDVLIDVAKDNQGAISYIDSLKEAWALSIISAMELVVGSRDKREVEKIDQLLITSPIVPLIPAIGARAYALLKQFAKSHGLRVFDALIAATALEEGSTLLTRNEKHFRFVPDLKLDIPQY